MQRRGAVQKYAVANPLKSDIRAGVPCAAPASPEKPALQGRLRLKNNAAVAVAVDVAAPAVEIWMQLDFNRNDDPVGQLL
jgi:hypothetical protein